MKCGLEVGRIIWTVVGSQMDPWSCGWIHVTFKLTIFLADITEFAKAIIGFWKIVRFLVKVKTSSNAASNQQHACYDHHSQDHRSPQVGGLRQLLKYDVWYVKLELAPWKNSVPHRVKLIVHTKRIVEARLWFYYIAGFQGWSIKTTVTECGSSEVQNDTTMLNKTWGENA
jgi:hypothetical protein